MRPVLEWADDDAPSISALSFDSGTPRTARMRLEMTDGARRLASASNIASAPATAFAYDQQIGGRSRLILAGQISYDETAPGRRDCDDLAAPPVLSVPDRTQR